MNDSADMTAGAANGTDSGDLVKAAARRLGDALDRLESRIGTVANAASQQDSELDQLRKQLAEAESFKADRAELAARLDQVTAEARDKDTRLAEREREFETLARRTEDEITAIAQQVDAALNADGGR